jgi:hypothetical protein
LREPVTIRSNDWNLITNISHTQEHRNLGRSDTERLLLAADNARGDLSINVALGRDAAVARVRGANRGVVSVVRRGGSRLASQRGRNKELENKQTQITHCREKPNKLQLAQQARAYVAPGTFRWK